MSEALNGTLEGILGSKKAVMSILAFLSALVARIGWEVSADELLKLVSPVVAYVFGQGLADFGKEAIVTKAAAEEAKPKVGGA